MVLERWSPGWGITPWRPLREIEDWEQRLEDFFGRPMWRWPVEERGWMPARKEMERGGLRFPVVPT